MNRGSLPIVSCFSQYLVPSSLVRSYSLGIKDKVLVRKKGWNFSHLLCSLAIKRPWANFPSGLEVDSNSVKTYKLFPPCLLGIAWPSTTTLYLFGEFNLQFFLHIQSRTVTSYPLLLNISGTSRLPTTEQTESRKNYHIKSVSKDSPLNKDKTSSRNQVPSQGRQNHAEHHSLTSDPRQNHLQWNAMETCTGFLTHYPGNKLLIRTNSKQFPREPTKRLAQHTNLNAKIAIDSKHIRTPKPVRNPSHSLNA